MTRVRAKVETALKGHLNTLAMRDQFADIVTRYLSFSSAGDIDIRIRDVRPVADGVTVVLCINNC